MAVQGTKHMDKVEVYWFTEQQNGYITDEDLEK